MKKVCANLDIPVASFIALGSYGCAFDIPHNRVLKITMDAAEARNAQHLVLYPVEGFAKYYSVTKIECDEYQDWNLYVIVMERLTHMSLVEDEMLYFLKQLFYVKRITNAREKKYEIPYERGFIYELTTHGYRDYRDFLKLNDVDNLKKRCRELYKRITEGDRSGYGWKYISFSKLKSTTSEDFKKMYCDINKIIKQAFEHDIPLRDCHAGNFAYSDGVLVTFDLSLSCKRNYKLETIEI
jgi:hypothetical protein